jgi:hypothetical protein
MTKKLQQKLFHCMIKFEIIYCSNHISILTKLVLIVKRNESRRWLAWENINSNKFIDIWREFVASSFFSSFTKIEDYALQIQRFILSWINFVISWAKLLFEINLFSNEKCAKQQKRWDVDAKNDQRCISRKFDIFICERQMKRNESELKKKIEFRPRFRIICDSSSSVWRLARWTRTRNHKSRKTSKVSNLSRRNEKNNVFKTTTKFKFKTRLLSKFFF